MRRSLRFSLAVVATLVAALLGVQPGKAHALLIRSLPEANSELASPPATLELWFSEPLEPAFSKARLLDPRGDPIQTGATVLDPNDPTHLTLPLGQLAPGIYTVAWQTLSQVDGHEWFGSLAFTVLNADGSRPDATSAAAAVSGFRGELPTPGEVAARWFALAGSMLLFGGQLFRSQVLPADRFARIGPQADRLLTWTAAAAAAGVLVGGSIQLLIQSGRLGGLQALPLLVLETRLGAMLLVRVLFAASAFNLALSISQVDRGRPRGVLPDVLSFGTMVACLGLLALSTQRLAAALAAALVAATFLWVNGPWKIEPTARQSNRKRGLTVLAIGLLLSFSVSSHAGAAEGSFYAVAGDFFHLLAAAAWVTGLLWLPILWRSARSSEAREEYFPAVRRFSSLALSAVTVVLLTGGFAALVELPTLRSLWETAYGRVLLVKVGLVGLALGIAYLNNRAVRAQSNSPRLPARIALEAATSAVILVTVAFLVQTPTPRSLTAEAAPATSSLPYNAIASAGELNIHLQVDPNRVGRNRFWTHLYTNDGSSIGEIQLVRLQISDLAETFGRSSLDLAPLGQGTFAAEGVNLSQRGGWSVEAYVRRRGMDDLLVPFTLQVEAGTPPASGPSHFGHPVPGIPPLVLIGGLLLSAGAVPFLWGRDLKALAGPMYRTWLLLGGATALVGTAGLVVGLLTADEPQLPPDQRSNPVPASPASIARGSEVYVEACAICHGPSGLGDGPLGVTLLRRPPDLWIHMQPGIHTDGQLFDWISNGFPDSPMPGFSDRYSADDRWNVINFIRTFADRPAP